MRSSVLAAVFLAGLLVGIGLSGRTQDYLVGSGLVYHLDGVQHCNNRFTKGLGYEHQLSKDTRLALGYYDNSNCNDSFYVAAAWLPVHVTKHISAGVIGGLVSGYSSSVLPVAGLIFTYEPGRYGFNLIFIPPAGDTSNGVLWGQVKVAF